MTLKNFLQKIKWIKKGQFLFCQIEKYGKDCDKSKDGAAFNLTTIVVMLVSAIYWLYKINISLQWIPWGGPHNFSAIFFNTLIDTYLYWVDCNKEHIMSSTPCSTQSLNQGWQICLTSSRFFKGKRRFLFHIILFKFIALSEISN